jgi:hypothetical protein
MGEKLPSAQEEEEDNDNDNDNDDDDDDDDDEEEEEEEGWDWAKKSWVSKSCGADSLRACAYSWNVGLSSSPS